MKAVWWLRVTFKRWLARHYVVIEFCKDCGVKQPLIWTADDVLWIDIWGTEGGVLCPLCFDNRCRARGLFVRWIPTIEEPGSGARVAEGSGLLSRPGGNVRASSNLAPTASETTTVAKCGVVPAPISVGDSKATAGESEEVGLHLFSRKQPTFTESSA